MFHRFFFSLIRDSVLPLIKRVMPIIRSLNETVKFLATLTLIHFIKVDALGILVCFSKISLE